MQSQEGRILNLCAARTYSALADIREVVVRAPDRGRIGAFALATVVLTSFGVTGLQAAPEPTPTPAMTALRDGQRDFDFLIGKWKYHLKRLQNPLTGSKTWIEFDGTGVCRPIWNGNAQIDELDVNGPTGRVQGLTLRLYNPESRQWNLNWSNASKGTLDIPTIGSFDGNGRGEFYDQETYRGRTIFVRYVWSGTKTGTPHFEQSFSDDGGKTWEVNWITDQVRVDQ
jgi:hypothetical protein